jgi:hypothetical protein
MNGGTAALFAFEIEVAQDKEKTLVHSRRRNSDFVILFSCFYSDVVLADQDVFCMVILLEALFTEMN